MLIPTPPSPGLSAHRSGSSFYWWNRHWSSTVTSCCGATSRERMNAASSHRLPRVQLLLSGQERWRHSWGLPTPRYQFSSLVGPWARNNNQHRGCFQPGPIFRGQGEPDKSLSKFQTGLFQVLPEWADVRDGPASGAALGASHVLRPGWRKVAIKDHASASTRAGPLRLP